jgi:hypothetical protein
MMEEKSLYKDNNLKNVANKISVSDKNYIHVEVLLPPHSELLSQTLRSNLKMKIHKIIILSVVLCVCKLGISA